MDHTPEPAALPEPAPPWPAQPSAPAPARRPARLVIATAVAALAVGGLGGYFLPHPDSSPAPTPTSTGGASSAKPATVSLVGTLTVTGGSDVLTSHPADGTCEGTGGYSDIAAGAQVVISDDSGTTLAITHLETGVGNQFSCAFAFRTDVPSGRGYYGVQVSHRGIVKEREQDLGLVAITLGD
jgi:hypothetical protein